MVVFDPTQRSTKEEIDEQYDVSWINVEGDDLMGEDDLSAMSLDPAFKGMIFKDEMNGKEAAYWVHEMVSRIISQYWILYRWCVG